MGQVGHQQNPCSVPSPLHQVHSRRIESLPNKAFAECHRDPKDHSHPTPCPVCLGCCCTRKPRGQNLNKTISSLFTNPLSLIHTKAASSPRIKSRMRDALFWSYLAFSSSTDGWSAILAGFLWLKEGPEECMNTTCWFLLPLTCFVLLPFAIPPSAQQYLSSGIFWPFSQSSTQAYFLCKSTLSLKDTDP